ncbi:cation-independent mannose-6-phosphate receptor-like [Antedon mediterranea]|uniref:cation-independent mannose-6-phosphate receptor-like n=1 Tax=Antedon mediterranea TaxID=105859 RepID=UPI003AF96DC2
MAFRPEVVHGNCSLILFLFIIICLTINETHSTTQCMAGKYDLTPISAWDIWHLKTKISDKPVHFSINPCGSLPNGICSSEHVSICMSDDTNTATVIGNFSETLEPKTFEHKGGFRLDFQGGICPSASGSKRFYNTSINFKCGNSLGSPILLESSACSFFIEWHTTAACDRVDHQAVKENRCYLYDNQNKKHDFTPLVKQFSGYLAVSNGDYDFYINVCRNIQAGKFFVLQLLQ